MNAARLSEIELRAKAAIEAGRWSLPDLAFRNASYRDTVDLVVELRSAVIQRDAFKTACDLKLDEIDQLRADLEWFVGFEDDTLRCLDGKYYWVHDDSDAKYDSAQAAITAKRGAVEVTG